MNIMIIFHINEYILNHWSGSCLNEEKDIYYWNIRVLSENILYKIISMF